MVNHGQPVQSNTPPSSGPDHRFGHRHRHLAVTQTPAKTQAPAAPEARLEPGRMTGAMASHPHGSEAAHGMPKEVRRSREAGPRESNPKQFHSDR